MSHTFIQCLCMCLHTHTHTHIYIYIYKHTYIQNTHTHTCHDIFSLSLCSRFLLYMIDKFVYFMFDCFFPQSCASGYHRVSDMLISGSCEPCECNGHSETCDPYTGQCIVSTSFFTRHAYANKHGHRCMHTHTHTHTHAHRQVQS